ncbi:trypsin-like peptidase domain-containing protein [Rhodococcus sp. X156]|uniref:S1C family serine protease n=1 Tax=Rhodococcus sp. X156 TaxID=2499145 RepID=UPI001F4988CE|nr:trypsin-like peptidase domain-containing protein [Rhodococcus sp. X156]
MVLGVVLAGCTSSSTPSPTVSSASAVADVPAIVDKVEPSVVTIINNNDLGSGVVYRSDGIILTAAHVVSGAAQVVIAYSDGQRGPATVRASDAGSDIAVLQASRQDLPAATFNTELPVVGAPTVVIGSPLGLQDTVTSGIISGLHREIPTSSNIGTALSDLIQTDAPISPGNSGGPLVNAGAEVIGLAEAYLPPTTGAVALGFATPAATVVSVADQLLASGTAKNPYVGLQIQTLTAAEAQRLELNRDSGVVVVEVVQDSPAANAGLQPGDVIISFDGKDTPTAQAFVRILRGTTPGQTVPMTVLRGPSEQQLQVVIGARAG